MTEEQKNTKEEKAPNTNDDNEKFFVPTGGVVIIALYLIALGIFIIFGLLAFWPPSSSIGPNELEHNSVLFLNSSFEISSEIRLMLIVAMAGALGSLVHATRSFFWYVGNRALVRSWILMYILLPLIGSFMGLIFYFVTRGGLFSNQAPIQAANPFGFAGLAGLVGMFSNQAALKLQEIAETMFSTKESTEGKDHVPSKTSAFLQDSQKDSETQESE
jgi:hypothetical protein